MNNVVKKGDRVRMSEELKAMLMGGCTPKKYKGPIDAEFGCINCSEEHLKEFEDYIGMVGELVECSLSQKGPEVNVRWEPSGLRYAYLPEHLVRV